MNIFKQLLLFLLIIAVAKGRFEDFVIRNKNDLKRFGDYDDIADEDNEFDEDYGINLELLHQIYKDEPNIMELLRDGSLNGIPADLLLKLQQYYAQLEPTTCEDDTTSLGLNVYDFI